MRYRLPSPGEFTHLHVASCYSLRYGTASPEAMMAQARTVGCFQIESPGQRELVKKLAPRDVGDLITDISLFRPGPVNSDMVTPFLRV